MTTTITKNKNENLNALAGKAAAEMAAAVKDQTAALAHAIKAGEFLNEAKSLVKHGEWTAWLETRFHGSERTAQNCMRLAGKSADPAVLEASSIAAALAAIAKPKALPEHTGPDPVCEAFRALAHTLPDMRDRIKLERGLPQDVRDKLRAEAMPYVRQIHEWFVQGDGVFGNPRFRRAWLRLVKLQDYDVPHFDVGTTPAGSVPVDELAAAFDATVE